MTPDWQTQAACRGTDTNLFFNERGDAHTLRTALEICNGVKKANGDIIIAACPVRQQCLEFATSFDDDNFGVFGGMTPSARLQIRRKNKKAQLPEPQIEYGYPGDNRRMYRSGRPLRSELPDRPLPTDYEWRLGLRELVRLIHEAVLDDENQRRAKRGLGPVAIQVRG